MTAHIGWMSLSTTTFDATNGSSGQADSAGWPIDSRNAGDWPTLVVEAGFSQTLPSLRAKMRWWFSASDHQVKVVVLVKMDASHETICIEKWVERPNRPGATTTRQVTRAGLRAPEPFCDQSINITWTGPAPIMDMSKQDRTPARFRVSGAPLVIGFAEVYLRAPTVGEHDIAITDVDLQHYASLIWKYIV
ncbi:hypothetical protein HMPREF1624_01581 [Sporothrix schenckii ATCC 58251]|uniref:Uncharacterized protein n=1 Tax=Sporothrix schenckii (strain ATCC 58251 / de Perez 2211183) TaxID=1391915 RepID=U7Q879_SPOS1|nr:hypothetical protein HMPREF1624_01581 [Sporothrix schenckii ATCC 58251]